MRNCVECPSPPGGEVCCEDGDTPICVIKDGRSRSLCRMISFQVSQSPEVFARAIVDDIVSMVGGEYHTEFLNNIFLVGGIFSFDSEDGRVRISAKQITSESGTRQTTASA